MHLTSIMSNKIMYQSKYKNQKIKNEAVKFSTYPRISHAYTADKAVLFILGFRYSQIWVGLGYFLY